MKLQLVPPRQGALWVRQGFAIFLRQPMGFAGLFASFLFIALLLMLVPYLGPPVLLALLPLGSLGFMVATRRVLAGRFPLPGAFVEPLRAGRPRVVALVRLGIAYAAATWAILWLCDLFDGGALDALMEAQAGGGATGPDAMAARLADPRLRVGVVLRFGLLGLLSIPFWHAPALVHWHGVPPVKSLFFSAVAFLRNLGAMLLYGASWLAVFLVVGFAFSALGMVLGGLAVARSLMMPTVLLMVAMFSTSLYFTFRDSFQADDESEPQTAPEGESAP